MSGQTTLQDLAQMREAVACKYVGAGLVFLFYDHTLSFSDEVEYIWKAKWTIPKLLFLFVRYAVPCALFLHLYQLTGARHGNREILYVAILSSCCQFPQTRALLSCSHFPYSCHIWFNLGVCLGIFSMGVGNFLVLLRIWIIWNRNKRLMLYTLSLFILAQVGVVVCTIIVLITVTPTLTFNMHLNLCALRRRSILGALYAPAMLFDGIALLSVFSNAYRRPHSTSRILIQNLYQDRFAYILLLFIMRTTNFLNTLFGPLDTVFLGICFIWATTTTTVSRLILDLRKHPVSTERTPMQTTLD